jgi:hypothetical protein
VAATVKAVLGLSRRVRSKIEALGTQGVEELADFFA